MQSHVTVSTMSEHALDQGDATNAVTNGTHVGHGQTRQSETAYARTQQTLSSDPAWRHKLILTGKLDHRSVSELEDEIECLCEEGVATLTLDLRQLDAIDSAGVNAIVRRGAVCKMRGHDFIVIPGSGVILPALAEAGATDRLTPDPNASVVQSRSSRSADGPAVFISTAMIMSL
jgi:anti-anti-sigma factor